ncbi:MAG: NADH-ubiquinone oxidoreductase-F iron-sulfur binding region domain-containing protein [Candidatus Omnitrophica bacterium]|nr:NADH-ubiquinone oxidoreductase-F iron-sulfur binding region domain-containing protein [Candidatus Omnitrophota bacterium]
MYTKVILVKDTDLKRQDRTREFYTHLLDYLRESNLHAQIQVVRVADIGVYDKGLVIKILPDKVTYVNVQDADIKRIVDAALGQGKVIEELVFKSKARQCRIVLRNCGNIDPESIEEYIASGGYLGLKKVLGELGQQKLIEEIKISGIRGRGGAGYPTWMKWNFAREVVSTEKFVICNADEGDPGAYMDRSVLEGDPHSVIEGLIIAAFAIGASKGYFYIRAEYPLAVERINKAIKQAYDYGLLGKNILGSSFNLDIEIRLGAGAFVCGEETALIASIEGKRGTPHPRPPYPSVKGLWDKPTVINNVETLANIPVIISKGGKWFAQIGTQSSKGTKVFAVTGKVKNSGLVEIAMGATLREIVMDICGGTLSGKPIKAVQTGGPSGGVIPETLLDTPVDYENLQKLGSIMGSGGMIVMDDDDCMVDIPKFYLGFCVEESCGKCAPCRIGGFQMLGYLNKITEGKGKPEDLGQMRRLTQAMQKASLCGLGQTASNPVISTLKYFESEYNEHILNKRCPAGKCNSLVTYTIVEDKCKRCGICVINCPVQAISGDKEQGYLIAPEKCVKCGRCFDVCKFKAISKK